MQRRGGAHVEGDEGIEAQGFEEDTLEEGDGFHSERDEEGKGGGKGGGGGVAGWRGGGVAGWMDEG